MAGTVQDQVKADWKKVQEEGGQRVGRIRKIMTAAASEAFDEVKEGSAEVQTISRKTLAEMIAQFKQSEMSQQPEATPEIHQDGVTTTTTDTTDIVTMPVAPEAEAEIPSWRQIFRDLWGIVNRHKGDWSYQLLNRLQAQMAQFDTNMTNEYSDRYRPFSKIVNRLRQWVELAANKIKANDSSTDPAAPVQVEVLDAPENENLAGHTS